MNPEQGVCAASCTDADIILITSNFYDFLLNTSLAAPGALANRLQRRTARKANEANLNPQIKNPRSLLYSNMGALINFR